MYFLKRPLSKDPFSSFGEKRSVYHYFFQKGTRLGFEMFIASGKESYLGKLKFKNALIYDGKLFKKFSGILTADAIYDRSGGITFPPKDLDRKILNCRKFKLLCNDKNKMYALLKEFMPKSLAVRNSADLKTKLKEFKRKEIIVLKPARGLCGKGIIIDKKENISKAFLAKESCPYTLQKFVDTSLGIRGIVSGKHDLRVVVVNGKVILAHVRTPKKGSYLANVAQGGKIKELPVEKIPPGVLKIVEKTQKKIDKQFGFPIYSIDFGVEKNKPYIFELNDQIGFPSKKMKKYRAFIDEILFSLEKLSRNKQGK